MRLATGLLCCFTFAAFGQDTPPPQQPPPQQPPPQQPAPQQPAPPAPGTPPSTKPQVQVPPQPQGQPSKAPAPERDTAGDYFSIMPFYWMTDTNPTLRKSHGSTVTQE